MKRPLPYRWSTGPLPVFSKTVSTQDKKKTINQVSRIQDFQCKVRYLITNASANTSANASLFFAGRDVNLVFQISSSIQLGSYAPNKV